MCVTTLAGKSRWRQGTSFPVSSRRLRLWHPYFPKFKLADGCVGEASGFHGKTSLHPQRLYKEQGENIKHHYTQTADLPEVLLAKLNAMNISEVRLMEGSWFFLLFFSPGF